ncbi:MAG TPA: chain length determinant protein EpsF [Burkholderiaceae bacterium]|nr:chain length determinant protein EpsF [Burkholderiaceae bacterium]
MSIKQLLRIIWARKWLVLLLTVVVAIAGTAFTLTLPKLYTAETSMVVEVRIDPALGALAPALGASNYMATQVEIIKSERVASRVVKMIGVERSPTAVQQWRDATKAKIPLERYFANLLQGGLQVEPSNGSNIINVRFSAQDPIFAQAAANAFAQAYMDVSVELRVAPARQSASFLDDQTKVLRTNLEAAQQRLSKFQQEKGIVVSDASFDQENARYQTLVSQLGSAQAERVENETRLRNSGVETSPDILASGTVQGLKSQLATAETKMTELSAVVGKNHPSRIQLEAQIGEIRQQIAAETRRVSGGTSTATRGSGQKVGELQAMVEEQRKKLLTLRADRDQVAVYQRDVDTAQRAYESVASRYTTIAMESQNNQANTRLLSPAVEPLEPSKPKIQAGIAGSLAGGLALGMLAALAWELLDRRVRDPEDLLVMAGVPVIGVLRPEGSKRPVFRKMLLAGPAPVGRTLLAGPGVRS